MRIGPPTSGVRNMDAVLAFIKTVLDCKQEEAEQETECPRCYEMMALSSDFEWFCYLSRMQLVTFDKLMENCYII
jgi:hypothetical protein